MEARKEKHGSDHPYTLNSMTNLAATYKNQRRWDEAEKLEVQVMEARKEKLGSGHPDTLNSMANLAVTYREQGRWDEGEKLDVLGGYGPPSGKPEAIGMYVQACAAHIDYIS